jgi:3,4-dihydroxy 2-butanone 4-phosphate synthase/GTP cyclohydrolase II
MSKDKIILNTIEEAIEDIRQGRLLLLLMMKIARMKRFSCCCRKVTPEMINFMATHGRGLICAPYQVSM